MNSLASSFKDSLNFLPQTLLKFASVGVLATLLHLGIFFLCQKIGLSPLASNFIAWLFAVTISYIGHKNWTFIAVKTHSNKQTQLKFIANSLLTLVLNAFLTYLFTTIIPNNLLIIFSVVLVTPLVSFFLMKYWVFISSQHS